MKSFCVQERQKAISLHSWCCTANQGQNIAALSCLTFKFAWVIGWQVFHVLRFFDCFVVVDCFKHDQTRAIHRRDLNVQQSLGNNSARCSSS